MIIQLLWLDVQAACHLDVVNQKRYLRRFTDMQVDPGLEREVHGLVEGYNPSNHECGKNV